MGGASRIILLAAGALALWPATASAASTFQVTRFDDPVPDGCAVGDCSLREAVIAANADPGSTINVPAGTVQLGIAGTGEGSSATGDLNVNADMTIRGAGAGPGGTTVNANSLDRVFQMSFGSGMSVQARCVDPHVFTASGLAITGGAGTLSSGGKILGGGGVAVCGTLNLSDSLVTANSAIGGGGIIVGDSSTANVDRTTISANTESGENDPGGGAGVLVEAGGTLNLTNSTVSGNTAGGDAVTALGEGGGIMNLGEANLTNVTVAGNSAGGNGAIAGVGGGILTLNPTTTNLVNTTITGNSVGSGGALLACGGNLSTTLVCGVPGTGGVNVKNTIVAAGSGAAGPNCTGGGITSQGNNIDSADECAFNAPGDQRNTDPLLGALGDNGGPTQTRALLSGSPAYNAGTNTGCPATDQRGIARPQALVCDVGAYELVPAADLAVTKTAPARLTLGNNLTYTLTVTNNGPQPAAGVFLRDTLPATAPLISAQTVGHCAGNPFDCTLPDLAPGASTTVTIVTRPRSVGSIINTATVSGTYADPNPANNTATATTTVAAPSVASTVSGVPAACRRTDFTIRVRTTTTDTLRFVRVYLDGRRIATSRSKSFTVRIPNRRARAGRHTIAVYARGTRGARSRRIVRFTRCPNPRRRASPRFTG